MRFEQWRELDEAESKLIAERKELIAREIEAIKAAMPAHAQTGLFDVPVNEVERAVRWWANPDRDRPKLNLGCFVIAARICGSLSLEPRLESDQELQAA